MGSAFRKSGGGILNHLDSEIVEVQFSDEFNGKPYTPGIDPKTKKEKFHSLYGHVSFLVDGAKDPSIQSLFCGDADAFTISDDGRALTPVSDGYQLGGNTAFGIFIRTLIEPTNDEPGYPQADPGDEAPYDFTPLIGVRLRTEQRTNEEKTKKQGTRKVKGADGKEREYPWQDLVCEAFYGGPAVKAKGRPAVASKANGKATRAVVPDVVDVAEVAAQALLGYLEASDEGKLKRQQLKMKVLTDTQFAADQALGKQVAAWLANADNIASIAEVDYDTTSNIVSLSA